MKFLLSWQTVRRIVNFLAYQWGTLDYQEEVVVRPEFKGTEYRTCTITPTRKFDAMLANHLASGDHYILQLLCWCWCRRKNSTHHVCCAQPRPPPQPIFWLIVVGFPSVLRGSNVSHHQRFCLPICLIIHSSLLVFFIGVGTKDPRAWPSSCCNLIMLCKLSYSVIAILRECNSKFIYSLAF